MSPLPELCLEPSEPELNIIPFIRLLSLSYFMIIENQQIVCSLLPTAILESDSDEKLPPYNFVLFMNFLLPWWEAEVRGCKSVNLVV